ncbi:MAG: sodium:calcium antiporter [Armatimonadetes bacterium]|nr:sodium:calcium antiporter [Armatimonadota bacterium]
MSSLRPLLPIFIAIAFTVPGVGAALLHVELSAPLTAVVAGTAILAASFLLLWACDAAQADVSQSMALAAVALIAVLPEYAVDMYFTWQAGQHPESDYAHYAIANMTGANRLIIGLGWAVIAAIFWFRSRGAVVIGEDRRLEVRFLSAATLYAFAIPIKGSLAWYDGVVLIGLFVWYLIIAGGRPQTDPDAEGPGEYIAKLPKAKRRATTILLLLFSAGAIIANAERFCEGLVATGKVLGINEFFLVQWLAPIASEAPEFAVAVMFALRAKAGLALGSLISSKLNQWTLLVGMIPAVYAVSAGTLAHPLPMDELQMHEILLTAAQSLLAVVMLAALRLSITQAVLLFVLFTSQLLAPVLVHQLAGGEVWGLHADQMHPLFSLFYLVAAVSLIADQPRRLIGLWRSVGGSPTGST